MKIFRYRTTPIALVIWIFCLWFLQQEVISQSFLTRGAQIDINDGALLLRQDFLGMYLANKKIGYSQFILKEDDEESQSNLPGKYYLFQSKMFLQVPALGFTMNVRTKQEGEVNEDLSVRYFTLSYDASGQKLGVLANVEDDGLHVKTTSEGTDTETVIPLSSPIYHTDMIHLVLARDGLSVGKETSFPIFDATTMSKGDINVKVLAKEKLQLPDGDAVDTYKVEINFKGLTSTSWINNHGDVYKDISQIAGITFTAMRETKEEATNMNFVSDEIRKIEVPEDGIDLINASRIKTPFPIKDPDQVSAMSIRMKGVEKNDIYTDNDLQTFEDSDSDELILNIKQKDYQKIIESLKEEQVPFKADESLKEYLREEALIQSNNENIRNKSLIITKNAKNRWQAAEMIANWLYKNIIKTMRVTIPSAIEVFNSMKGDCNEHSTLFAAMARSIGLPAKICAGLVYQDDGFYYHAWNEVYIDGQWLPIDATLNRIYMDAAHIKLAEGSLDSQTDIVNMIGTLDVDVLGVEYN
jgi:hypothetical protein